MEIKTVGIDVGKRWCGAGLPRVRAARSADITVPGGDYRCQIELRPAVAVLAVGRQLVLVAVQAAEGAEVDHARA